MTQKIALAIANFFLAHFVTAMLSVEKMFKCKFNFARKWCGLHRQLKEIFLRIYLLQQCFIQQQCFVSLCSFR